MDVVAGVFVDLVVTSGQLPPLLNVVHTQTVSWHLVVENINRYLPKSLPLIPAAEWLAKLESSSINPSSEDLERIVRAAPCMRFISKS